MAADRSAFQLEHMLQLQHSTCPVGYEIRTMKYAERSSCRSIGNTMGVCTKYIGLHQQIALLQRWDSLKMGHVYVCGGW